MEGKQRRHDFSCEGRRSVCREEERMGCLEGDGWEVGERRTTTN